MTLYQSVNALLMRWRDDGGQDQPYRAIKAELADELGDILIASQGASAETAMANLITKANAVVRHPQLGDMTFMHCRPGAVIAMCELQTALAKLHK